MRTSVALLLSIVASAVWIFSPENGWAQQPAASAETSAHLLVTVEPKHGTNAPEIRKEDVMVYEGHDRDQVVDWIPLQGDRAGLQ